jgi:hypothetical protein
VAGATPVVAMTTFVDYVMTNGAARLQLVSRQVEQYADGWKVATDYYRPMLTALKADLRLKTGTTNLAQAATLAIPARQGNFAAIRDGVERWVKRMNRLNVDLGVSTRWVWNQPDVNIKVYPDFTLVHPDGMVQVVKVYFKEPVMSRWTATAGIRLMQYAGTSLCGPKSEPCILDARRGKLWTPDPKLATPRIVKLDGFLRSEAAAYGQLWRSLDQAS